MRCVENTSQRSIKLHRPWFGDILHYGFVSRKTAPVSSTKYIYVTLSSSTDGRVGALKICKFRLQDQLSRLESGTASFSHHLQLRKSCGQTTRRPWPKVILSPATSAIKWNGKRNPQRRKRERERAGIVGSPLLCWNFVLEISTSVACLGASVGGAFRIFCLRGQNCHGLFHESSADHCKGGLFDHWPHQARRKTNLPPRPSQRKVAEGSLIYSGSFIGVRRNQPLSFLESVTSHTDSKHKTHTPSLNKPSFTDILKDILHLQQPW